MMNDIDAQGLQLGGVAHPGELQELRRVDRTAAEDDLSRVDTAPASAGQLVVDADRAGALEAHPGDEGPGGDGQVRTVLDRVQVGPGR